MRLQLLLLLFLTKVSTRSSTNPRLEFIHSVINTKTIRLPSRRVQLIENEENGVIVNTGQQLFSLDFSDFPKLKQVSVQHLGLVANGQDKVYAFFKEKHPAESLESDMWLPFVAQVCMADKGGNKNILEYRWTTHLKARLFCGDRASGQHYPELVDVSFLHKEDGALSAVYALFWNEWSMSAVCVYSIDDIEKVFKTSAFKANKAPVPDQRPGTCTYNSQTDKQMLTFMQKQPEVVDRVRSMNNAGPLLVSQHRYTHILLDTAHTHTLLYLSLVSGRVHKVLDNKTRAFIIAEYRPFTDKAHILDMILHKPTRKLYVSSSKEVVQVDVQSCEKYGPQCEDCVLARDPYCGWNGHQCVEATSETLQDVEKGDHTICLSSKEHKEPRSISAPLGFSVFMRCPVSSRHAEYTWHRPGNITTTCDVIEKSECNVLIERVVLEDGGVYRCMEEERGYKTNRRSFRTAGGK
ncbi:Semaphorin-7A [Merluccius polli]|uniref:Semaphorin-7A n=1 Tax=Merluccius polli TaxID=89951 RepID=A0AA47M581_MERPO|nr:Semaphorin-7A [Merluccius polli]